MRRLLPVKNRQDRAAAWTVNEIPVEQFIASQSKVPAKLILDFDATDTPVHGKQEGRAFHGYFRNQERSRAIP